jgi:hypothetical protein
MNYLNYILKGIDAVEKVANHVSPYVEKVEKLYNKVSPFVEKVLPIGKDILKNVSEPRQSGGKASLGGLPKRV